MDYEQKYKEILEWARKNKARLNGVPIEEVLPELAESEDERALRIIRKRLCYDPVPISDEDRRIVENWLEKQKEQKPAWSEEDEKMICSILDNLRRYQLSMPNFQVELQMRWLKSLPMRCPKASDNWKPGEEMMQNYIRKDALLEWIQEARAIPHENAIVRDLAFQEVINKLNSM